MKKVYSIVLFVACALVANAQSVFYEGFENGITAQMTQQYVAGTLNWITNPALVNLGPSSATFEGDSAAHLYFGGNSEARTALITPSIDLSASGYKLGFALAQAYWAGDQNTTAIHYSGNDGATWTLIDSITTDLQNYTEFEYALADYATTTATSKFKFTGYNTYGYAIGLDAINVFLPPVDDAEVTDAVSPVDGCGLGSETVSIEVFNNGLDTIFTISATYEVGAVTESETFTVQIAPGATDTLVFSVLVDLSVAGSYDLVAWTDLVDDLDANNDTITFSVNSIPVVGSLPYSQDFENGDGGWVADGILNSWELGAPANTFINEAHSGVNAWVTNLDGDYADNERSYVESPCFDFSSLTIDPVFRFAFKTATEAGWDGTWIEVSTDAGVTWATVGSVGEGTNWYNNADEHGTGATEDWWDATLGTASTWLTATHLLDGAAGSSSVKIRVSFYGDVVTTDEGFAFDDIQIFEQPAINAGVTEILSPVSGCGIGTELVTIVIQNFGDADLVDFNIEYNAGAGIVTEFMTDTLFASEIDTITFTVPVDLSVLGNYNFGAWTAVAGDGDAGNDSVFATVSNIPVISTLPYVEGFESGDGGWTSGGVFNSWQLGDPQGAFIDTANSGINAWVTNLAGDYPISEASYIESPCFDFSNLSIDPILEFAHIFNTESCCDEGYVDVSVDAGTTWTRLGAAGEGTNWYNDVNNDWWNGASGLPTVWRNAMHLLDGTAGESSVKIRFVFSSDFSINEEGFGVDDISIVEQPAVNSEVVAVVAPISGCGLTTSEMIQVHVANLGSTVMDSVIIGFSLDNGSAIIETFNNSIAIGGDTTFTLTQTIDLSANTDYSLTVWTGTIGDGDLDNDTLTVVITSVPTIVGIPYEQDFETGNGGWVAGGVNSSWELGEPETAFIDTANSGINAWVTNLTGNYSDDELSYVESPCIDFSSITEDPVLKFAGIFRTEACCDEGWVDVSLDGGLTWTKLGAAGEGENWYNDAINDWWDGTSGLANMWADAEHILTGAAGQAAVRIRFVFRSDGSVVETGFGLDDIRIVPQPQLDLEVISFDGPSDNCSLDQESVTMTFWNKGLMTVSNFDLGFRVNSAELTLMGAAQTATYTGSVANGDTVTYTFTTEMADLSQAATYEIDVFTALAGDENTDSDSLFASVVVNYGESTPLSQTAVTALPISSTILGGTSSPIFFCGLPSVLDGCLEIDNVTIDSIAHTWLSDLDIYLISPVGDTIELSTDNGGSADNMSNVIFSDTSTNDITLQTVDIMPGIYHTEDSLGFTSFYDGQDPNGAWTLWVNDDLGGDDGTLISWSMTFVDHSPSPMLAYSDTSICLTQVLTVTTGSYSSYLWSTGNNTQSPQLFGNVLGLGAHEIYVTVDQAGCTGVSNSFVLTVDACAGITELGDLSIDVYPNPSNGEFVLDVAGDSEGFNLSIVSVNGQSVYQMEMGNVIGGVRKAIDLGGVSKGIYFMTLSDANNSVTRKLIVQ